MVNLSAKFDEEADNGLVSFIFTRLFPYTCMSILWQAHNSLVSIMSTSLFQYIAIVTLTFDLQNR